MTFESYSKEKRELIEQALAQLLPGEDERPPLLHKAMRYSVLSAGKRIRPLLCLASAEAVGSTPEKVLPIACALELLHSYSIIHDDLPAMDNDATRRGRAASHVAFGEAVAILAGDALLTEAFRILADVGLNKDLKGETLLTIAQLVARAAGSLGMAGGQVDDLNLEGKQVSLAEVKDIHHRKTGSLIKVSILAGALAGNAGPEELKALDKYGECLGLAFQVSDDIIDLTSGEQDGVSYPALAGLGEARKHLRQLGEQALEALKGFDVKAEPLREIVHFVLSREQ